MIIPRPFNVICDISLRENPKDYTTATIGDKAVFTSDNIISFSLPYLPQDICYCDSNSNKKNIHSKTTSYRKTL
jgi:hypothetical protein